MTDVRTSRIIRRMKIMNAFVLLASALCPALALGEVFVEVNGVVSMEAEHCTANLGYTVRSDNGPSGQASGWSGDGWVYSDSSAAQRLRYRITFTRTGTYWLHLRALAGFNEDWSSNLEGLDNGFHAELDGVRISGPGIYVRKEQRWAWYGRYQDGQDSEGVSFTVATPGEHVFSIVRREDLSRLDKIVIHDGTYGTTAAGTLSGAGPAETIDPGAALDAGAGQPDTALPPLDAGAAHTTRIEAEHMTLSTYRVEGGASFASNGAMISFLDGAEGESGAATASFSGAAARYDVVLAYFDENDGVAQLQVSIDGAQVDSFDLNQDLSDNRASAQTLVRRTVAQSHLLAPGSTLRITGTEDAGEHARVDYLELIPVAGVPDAALPDLALPDHAAPDLEQPDSAPPPLPLPDAGATDLPLDDGAGGEDALALEQDGGVDEALSEAGCTCASAGSAASSPLWLPLLCALLRSWRRRSAPIP